LRLEIVHTMAHDNAGKNNQVKSHFTTREGKYKIMHLAESFYGKTPQYSSPQQTVTASNSTPVKTSFVKVDNGNGEEDCICLTIGRELFYFLHKAIQQENQQLDFIDKRTYRGVAPTCHDINQHSATGKSVRVAVGFTAGQVQIIDVKTKSSLHIMNEDRSVDKSRVTCVKWYPNNDKMLLASHNNGNMYTYDVTQQCSNVSLTYQEKPVQSDSDIEIFKLDVSQNSSNSAQTTPLAHSNGTVLETSSDASPSVNNPMYKWVITKDGSAVNNMEFSPCGRDLAVVTQNGFLRVFDHSDFRLVGSMKSYFGGLLCCAWSPDGRFIAMGGEDDLVTIWSFCQGCVVARGTGHSSWITDVAFDPHCTEIPSDDDVSNLYDLPSVDDVTNQLAAKLTVKDEIPRSHVNGSTSLLGNGDRPSMRRLRTFSNVSKLSRLSTAGEVASLSYRFGSVGQDSQLCLWEVDSNVLACAREKRATCTFLPLHGSHGNAAPSEDDLSEAPNSSSASVSSGGTNGVKSTLEVDGSSLSNRSLSNPQLPGNGEEVKKKKSWPSFAGKFATLGSAERRGSRKQSDKKIHKRNASVPFFGFRNDKNVKNKKLSSNGQKNGCREVIKEEVMNLGSEMCPRIDQTHMLEPIVCKKIASGRLTGIDFTPDGIVTTCQDGFIQLWRRPEGE